MDRRSTLVIVCGLPGAGKTTHARRLEAELGAVRLCPDEWMQSLSVNLWDESARARIEALQWRLARQLLRRGVSVLIEFGTWSRSERATLREGARSLGARVELHYLTAPADVLLTRIQSRALEDPPITRAQLDQWITSFQEPSADEALLYDKFIHIDQGP